MRPAQLLLNVLGNRQMCTETGSDKVGNCQFSNKRPHFQPICTRITAVIGGNSIDYVEIINLLLILINLAFG